MDIWLPRRLLTLGDLKENNKKNSIFVSHDKFSVKNRSYELFHLGIKITLMGMKFHYSSPRNNRGFMIL